MNKLEVTNEEQEILEQVLRNALAVLESEIGHTDHKEFRTLLKHRREVLNALVAKLAGPVAAAA